MNPQTFERACMMVVRRLRERAPKDTGNLAYNAIRFEWVNPRLCRIYVDEEIAPYMKYTNEPWDIKIIEQGTFRKGETRTVVRTWQNPNEGWFDRSYDTLAAFLAGTVKGELRKR